MKELCENSVTLEAVVKPSYAGAVRILTDSERFGLNIVEFSLLARVDGGGMVRFAISRTNLDPEALCARFARHPAVGSVQIVDADATGVEVGT